MPPYRITDSPPLADPLPGQVPAPIIPVHTAVPGRARLRVVGLRRMPHVKQVLEEALPRLAFVRQWEASLLTGNVLIFYHADVPLARLVDCLADALGGVLASAPVQQSGRHRRAADAGHGSASDSPTDGVDPTTLPPGDSHKESATWHARPAHEVVAVLETSVQRGLGHAEVAERRARFGSNVLQKVPRRSALRLFLSQFLSPAVALLGASATVAVATGGLLDAAAILGVVLINAAIGFVTESQAERIIATLDKSLPQSIITVRDGGRCQTHPRDLVVGDILLLLPGCRLPADGRLLEANRMTLDESALTGESMPTAKDAGLILPAATPLAERRNMVYGGTSVTGGSGKAVVVATGGDTEMGRIQALVGEAQPPQTPMERQLARLGSQLAILSGAICGVVFGVGLLRGQGWLAMLRGAISLAVAAVPEGLPTVATTTLALGIREMRRRKVLIRQLSAVEALGAIQVLCLDKTGTLTVNRMTVVALHAGMQRFAVVDGQMLADGRSVEPHALHHLRRLLETGALCSEADLSAEQSNTVLIGSPTEQALLQLALQAGLDIGTLRAERPLLHMQHRSEDQQYMLTAHRTAGGRRWIAVKGSPAEVLALCQWYLVDHQRRPLTAADRAAILSENDTMAGEALRVLGLAYDDRGQSAGPVAAGLCWLGLVGMADPVRPGMGWLLGRLHRAGIQTAIITGDQSPTAYAIGKQLRVSNGAPLEILDSTRLEKLDPEVLAGVVRRVHVFSRVSPAHKLQIVQALQRAGRVVAMTGDGINDGPALKAADLGVAMGKSGTEAARTVADVVLEDDNLNTLVVAVRQGRTVYSNIRKALHFLLATNFTEIEVMLAGVALGLGQPLTPMQLLWINLISDIVPGLALAMEPPEPDTLERPPRDPEAGVVTAADLRWLASESAAITGGTLASYGYALFKYGPGPQASTQAFMTLTLGQLLHAMSCRSETHSLFDKGVLPANYYLDVGLTGSLLAQLLTVTVPGLRQLLGTTPLGLADGLVAVGGALAPLLINETIKRRAREQDSKSDRDTRAFIEGQALGKESYQ